MSFVQLDGEDGDVYVNPHHVGMAKSAERNGVPVSILFIDVMPKGLIIKEPLKQVLEQLEAGMDF